jgi:hypothetical protein
MTTLNSRNLWQNFLIDFLDSRRVAEVFPNFDGVHFDFGNELVELGRTDPTDQNVQLARQRANNLGAWYLRIITWPLVDVFHQPTLRMISTNTRQFSAESRNPNVGEHGILGRQPTTLNLRNIATVAPTNGLRYLTTDFFHSISELDMSPMQ